MPEAPTPPKIPKHFPDLQGANAGRTPGQFEWQYIIEDAKQWILEQNLPTQIGAVAVALMIVIIAAVSFYYREPIMNTTHEATEKIQDTIATFSEDVQGKVENAKTTASGIFDRFKETVYNHVPHTD